MKLHSLDIAIIVGYFLTVVLIGLWVSRRGVKDLDSYFLGGKSLPWYLLGVSDASGMFDIAGTMWLVYVLFLYGLKSIWLPWVWPTFNQIFLMMFLSAWLRRSNVLTGAQWIQTRFGNDRGGTLAHLSVVIFALVNVIGLLAYAFKGIGKFAAVMLPWSFGHHAGIFSDDNIYAMILMGLTSLYAIKGGMISVVITEVMQFTILTLTSLTIGLIAIVKVSPAMIAHNIPDGWMNPFFGKTLGIDWTGILDHANGVLSKDGNELFSVIFGLMFFKGVLASLAGPAPNYDMQRILATRNPREACLMNGMVTLVLMFPRYMMIAGITVLALAFCMPEIRAAGSGLDFEKILPMVLSEHIPVGVLGFLLAGLAAAFMSNFAATLNAAPAYVVNDLYKRFINPNAGGKKEVALSRIVSLIFLVVGIVFGFLTNRITDVMMWLVGGLYGGFVVANMLKWYWWRFNGYGYFWGMTAGILSAMLLPESAFFPGFAKLAGIHVVNALYLIPAVIACSVVGCLAGTWFTQPEDDETLKKFYKTVNPWGWWGPVRAKVVAEDPSFAPNRSAARDLMNVAVGIVWQLCLVTLPIYIVLHQWFIAAGILALLVATSAFMKFNWYDKLEKA
jgi:Na+/proline symporter